MTQEQSEKLQDKLETTVISRRQLIKASGIAALGLSFSAPLIQTVSAKPAFTGYGGGGGDDDDDGGSWGDDYWRRRRRR